MTNSPIQDIIDEFTKPKPLEVVEHVPTLKGAQVLQFWLATALIFQFRTAVVWAFLALFFPQFGATWFMVMFGLWAIRHAKPISIKHVIKAVAKQKR
jgi:hypothetical protein